jgi:hypothetical protein
MKISFNMKNKKFAIFTLLIGVLTLAAISDCVAQSGVYVGGHIRRARPATITKLKASGFQYVILFNVHVEQDGSLSTDGDTICRNGQYVFAGKHPYYVADIKSLKTPPTSIERIEICIGGWGNTSYKNIKQLYNANAMGANSVLYRNFKALKEAIPEIDAVNNDTEDEYDVNSAVAFHLMMDEIGYKTTLAPYTNKSYWTGLVDGINQVRTGVVERVLIQCYGGGAGNNPSDWHIAGIPLHAGRENYQNFSETQTVMQDWKANKNVSGGFFWVYNDETWDLNKYATAVNRIFGASTITHITDRAGLEAINLDLNGSYILDNDVDLSGANWTPLGNFAGTLDGNHHVIFNLTIDNLDAAALFGTISGNAVVKNLGFENALITDATHARTAVLAAYMRGSAVIENCYVANSVIKGRWCVGSFVGRAEGTSNAIIRSCYSSAYLYTPDYNGGAGHTGGIIGNIFADGVTVESCYFSGVIQRILGNNAEGQVAGIVGWNGKGGPNQENVASTIKNNVSLAPYLLSNHGKRRIAGAIQDQNGGDPTPGPNYSLSTTVVSAYDGWGSTSDTITGESEQYGADKKDGLNIPGGDDKAKAQEFYEATLGWDFDNTWTIDEGNAYPVLQWADATRPSFVVVNTDLVSLTAAAPVDLSKYIFSGRGLGLTFSTTSQKISVVDGVVSFGQEAVTEADTVVVSVQEGSLTPLYSLQVALAPAYYSLAVGTFAGGSVTADKNSYVENEAVTLTIATEAGYELADISAHKTDDTETSVALDGSGSERTFAMPAYDVTVSALFTTTAEYSVTVGTFTGGSVTADAASYKGNEAVTLTIAPAAGYELTAISAHKTDDTETSVALAGTGSERTFTMPAYGVTVAATFTKIVYSVTIGTFTGGSVTADKASCAENEAVTLTIVPAEGYELTAISAHKTGDNQATVSLTGTGSERTFAMPAYGVTVVATFGVRQTDVSAENVSAVTVTGRNGEVQARFEGTAPVKLYSLTGALLNEATASGGYTYSVRQKGIYVLSVAGKSYKVLVE